MGYISARCGGCPIHKQWELVKEALPEDAVKYACLQTELNATQQELEQYKKQNQQLQARNTELVLRNREIGAAMSIMAVAGEKTLRHISGAKSEVAQAEEYITTLMNTFKKVGC